MTKKKQPQKRFTMERLHAIRDQYGTLNANILQEEFPDMSRRAITMRLHQNRTSGLLTYEDYDQEIILTRSIKKAPVIDDELGRLKTWLAVANAYRLNDLIDSKSLRAKDELEAIKELGRIERGLTNPVATEYAKRIEEDRNMANIWQTKKAKLTSKSQSL